MKPKRISNPKLLAEIRLKPCIACGHTRSDAAHIKSKGSGGDDIESNLLPLCRVCHSLQHRIGWSQFLLKNIKVNMHLTEMGWYIDAEGKLKHDSPDLSQDA